MREIFIEILLIPDDPLIPVYVAYRYLNEMTTSEIQKTLVFGDSHVSKMEDYLFNICAVDGVGGRNVKDWETSWERLSEETFSKVVLFIGGNDITPHNGAPVQEISDTVKAFKKLTTKLLQAGKTVVVCSVITRTGYKKQIDWLNSRLRKMYRANFLQIPEDIQVLDNFGVHLLPSYYKLVAEFLHYVLQ